MTGSTSLGGCVSAAGFPHPHSGLGQQWFDMMVLLLPCIFLTMAELLWPSAGLEQVALVWLQLKPSLWVQQ